MVKAANTKTKTKTKQSVKKPAAKKATQAVDYEPNKMTFLVAALAAVSLVVLALLATYS